MFNFNVRFRAAVPVRDIPTIYRTRFLEELASQATATKKKFEEKEIYPTSYFPLQNGTFIPLLGDEAIANQAMFNTYHALRTQSNIPEKEKPKIIPEMFVNLSFRNWYKESAAQYLRPKQT